MPPRNNKKHIFNRYKAVRGGTKFSSKRVRSLFTDGVLLKTRAQTHQFLSVCHRSDYHTVLRQAQALGASVGAAKCAATTAPAIGSNKKPGFRREAETLSLDSAGAEGKSTRISTGAAKILALTNCFTLPCRRSSNLFFTLSRRKTKLQTTPETKNAPGDPLTPSHASAYYTPPSAPRRPTQCVLCLGPCAVCRLVSEADRDCLLQVRESSV